MALTALKRKCILLRNNNNKDMKGLSLKFLANLKVKNLTKMKNFYTILTFLFLVSCSTSSDVVQHGFIQKRKYTKGFTHHKKDRSLFKKNSFSIYKKTNEIVNDVQNPLKKLQSDVPSVTANKQKKTPEPTALIASNNNDILINTDELLKENYFIKNDISELIKIKNKPFKKIRVLKEIIELTNDGDDEAKDKSKRNFIYNLILPGLGTMLNGEIGLGILQLLLFVAGIFGAYWIFWNTNIHTIFPILISVFAYLWSGMSGYNNYDPFVKNLNKNETSISTEMENTKNSTERVKLKDVKSAINNNKQELQKNTIKENKLHTQVNNSKELNDIEIELLKLKSKSNVGTSLMLAGLGVGIAMAFAFMPLAVVCIFLEILFAIDPVLSGGILIGIPIAIAVVLFLSGLFKKIISKRKETKLLRKKVSILEKK